MFFVQISIRPSPQAHVLQPSNHSTQSRGQLPHLRWTKIVAGGGVSKLARAETGTVALAAFDAEGAVNAKRDANANKYRIFMVALPCLYEGTLQRKNYNILTKTHLFS